MAMTCPDCEQNLDDVQPGYPCPRCGGNRRSALAQGSAVLVAAAVMSPTVSIGYNPSPGWSYQWRIIQRHLDRMREQYQGTRMLGNVDVEENAHALFLALFHLYDWLHQDSSTSLTKPTVLAWIKSHQKSLGLCRDYANTLKHMTRDKPDARIAQITKIASGPNGQTVKIGYRLAGQPNAVMKEIDGLALAEESEDDWRYFLNQHSITIPN